MRQTVIGIFNSENDAQNAVQQLVNDGFTRDSIDVSQDYSDRGTTTSAGQYDDDNDTFGEKVSSFFGNLFGNDNEDQVRNYSTLAKQGVLVTVHAQSPDEAERAADILDLYGAIDVNESTSGNNSQLTNAYSTGQTADFDLSQDRVSDATTESSLPIIEEELQVGKREVETGGVRLRSRIIERPVEENLRLRYERVSVERNPVNRAATEADFNQFEEGTVELTERAEVPVVSKEARVVEEVRLGKEVEERTETIRDTVRKTDVEVERLDSDNDVTEFRKDY